MKYIFHEARHEETKDGLTPDRGQTNEVIHMKMIPYCQPVSLVQEKELAA